MAGGFGDAFALDTSSRATLGYDQTVRRAILILFFSCKSRVPHSPTPIEVAMEHAAVPGISVAVVRDGRVSHAEVAGMAARGSLVREDTTFEAASIGKPIIAIAAMQLAERGAIALDDDCSSHLPFPLKNPRFTSVPITLRMLLSHTSSVHDKIGELRTARGNAETLSEFLRAYVASSDAFLASEPGTKEEYSNVGFSLAALAVEHTSHQRFDSYVAAHIFSPAGASASYRRGPNAATPHRGSVAIDPIAHAVYPVVDLFASASDLAKIAAALLRGELLSRDRCEEMWREHLGWQPLDLDGRALVGHEGEDDGASTMLFLDPKTKNGAIVLTNGDAFASNDHARAEALKTLLKSLFP